MTTLECGTQSRRLILWQMRTEFNINLDMIWRNQHGIVEFLRWPFKAQRCLALKCMDDVILPA